MPRSGGLVAVDVTAAEERYTGPFGSHSHRGWRWAGLRGCDSSAVRLWIRLHGG